jgi:hypothetical protein
MRENENVEKYAAALFRDSNVMAFPQDISSDEEEDSKPAAHSCRQCPIAMTHLDASKTKEVVAKDEDDTPQSSHQVKKISHDIGRHVGIKGPRHTKNAKVFLTLKGFTPVAPLAPKQLFAGSNLAHSSSCGVKLVQESGHLVCNLDLETVPPLASAGWKMQLLVR